jgi:ectoine hydroxylase-related dioxygenase (phytanoyl-CoA dioxygenase family)
VAEYADFETLRVEKDCVVRDENQRNYRVMNLHLKSKALLSVGMTRAFHESAGRFFGAKSTLYTSLFFKHGSQQDPHIDTPFFWTRPFNLFVGVWVALEDVRADAGPLVYYPGSQRYFNSEAELRDVFVQAGRDEQKMFKVMQAKIEQHCVPETVLLKKGDAVIWHPGLMHGGTKASTPGITRNSGVFHLAPLGVNVRDDRTFPDEFRNMPTYGLKRYDGGYYCRGRLPKAMI